MKLSILLLPFAVILCAAAFVGCAEESAVTASASTPANKICPMMGGKVDGRTTVEWNGKTIGFCCPPCIDEWATMTDEERTKALAEATVENDHGDHDHGDDADHGDHSHADHAADGEHHDHAQPEGEHDHGAHDSSDAHAAPAEAVEEAVPAK